VDDARQAQCPRRTGGNLVIRKPWPGDAARHLGRHPALHGHLLDRGAGHATSPATAAGRDKDGYFWIMGRIDDVLNVSGHRIGTAEVESALV
jgi:acetyl-CoA synthetase